MATAPSFAFYLASGGMLSEALFLAALPGAQATVDAAVWPNMVTDTTLAAYQRAVCAVVDLVDAGDTDGSVSSEGLGKAQVAYNAPNVLAMSGMSAHPVGRAIAKYLTGTGLLYRGI